jgi:hypothetical protein
LNRRRLILALLAPTLLLLAAAPSATAKRHVVVGIGEQTASPFSDPAFARTGIRTVRLVVPYNVVRKGGKRLLYTDIWMTAARRFGVDPLVSFSKRDGRRGKRYLPSVREYIRDVRRFRKRYRWVHMFATWNEANLPKTQPTGRHPRRAAAYYRAFHKRCRRHCTLLAPEFLATATMQATNWLHTFARHAGRGPHIWAVHTYPDTNRFRTFRTRRFLRTVPRGKIWITETGGIVRFHSFHRNTRRAARAVRHSFALARLSRRFKRIYLYQWSHNPMDKRWDSGFVTSKGRTRPAYRTLLRFIRKTSLFRVKKPKPTPQPKGSKPSATPDPLEMQPGSGG